MGGLISLLTTLRLGNERVAGVILTAPELGANMTLELQAKGTKVLCPGDQYIGAKGKDS